MYKRQGLDGYELLEYLRPLDTSVIFITAKGTLGDRVKGLNLGADDYIVKPFEVEELVARVESVLRRSGKGGSRLETFDVVDVYKRQSSLCAKTEALFFPAARSTADSPTPGTTARWVWNLKTM